MICNKRKKHISTVVSQVAQRESILLILFVPLHRLIVMFPLLMRLKIRVKIYFLLHSPLFASLQSQRGVPCLAHHWWLRLYKKRSSLEVQILREDYHRILAQGLCLLSLDLWMLFIRGREMRCLEWRWEHVALVSFFPVRVRPTESMSRHSYSPSPLALVRSLLFP